MADLDNDQVNDLEIGIIGSGSMGAVSPAIPPDTVECILNHEIDGLTGDDATLLRAWI